MPLEPPLKIINELIIDSIRTDLEKTDALSQRVPSLDLDLAGRRVCRLKDALFRPLFKLEAISVLELEMTVAHSPRVVGEHLANLHPRDRIWNIASQPSVDPRNRNTARPGKMRRREHAGVEEAPQLVGKGMRAEGHGEVRSVFGMVNLEFLGRVGKVKRWMILVGCVITASGCGGDSSGPSTVTLPLTSVDARALPTTVPAGSGTVQVASGRLVGDSDGPACSWYVVFNPGGESFGSIGDCTVEAGDIITLTWQVGPTAGSHSYRFGQ